MDIKSVLDRHKKWLDYEEGGERADLRGVDLRRVDLRGVDLSGVNLSGADLRGADLRGVNLSGVILWGCAGNRNEIRSLFISDVYTITYTSEYLQIGCKRYPIEEWWKFDDKAIDNMDRMDALNFWHENKDFIRSAIEKYPATPTGHEESCPKSSEE